MTRMTSASGTEYRWEFEIRGGRWLAIIYRNGKDKHMSEIQGPPPPISEEKAKAFLEEVVQGLVERGTWEPVRREREARLDAMFEQVAAWARSPEGRGEIFNTAFDQLHPSEATSHHFRHARDVSDFIIGRFRHDGGPCTWRQLKALVEKHGDVALALVELLESEEIHDGEDRSKRGRGTAKSPSPVQRASERG